MSDTKYTAVVSTPEDNGYVEVDSFDGDSFTVGGYWFDVQSDQVHVKDDGSVFLGVYYW